MPLKHGDVTAKVIRVFYDVYNELGHGFLESVYQQSMAIALTEVGLEVQCQVPIPVWFRGHRIGDFRSDIVVERSVLLELKAAKALDPAHQAQLLHYLRATEIEIGLLLSFGLRPQFLRLLFDNDRKKTREHVCVAAEGF
ncbi:MAG TPA: GxxExxY protein [Terriglobales bacterium]|nr:GxxExxY protein [Terriglobales bacterium]